MDAARTGSVVQQGARVQGGCGWLADRGVFTRSGWRIMQTNDAQTRDASCKHALGGAGDFGQGAWDMAGDGTGGLA